MQQIGRCGRDDGFGQAAEIEFAKGCREVLSGEGCCLGNSSRFFLFGTYQGLVVVLRLE
jgi:hypothetical protein